MEFIAAKLIEFSSDDEENQERLEHVDLEIVSLS